MRLLLLLACGFAISCSSTSPTHTLQEGLWTGSVSAHEGHHMETSYKIEEVAGILKITLIAPDEMGYGNGFPARDIRVTSTSLAFSWTEPEANVPLACLFERQSDGSYEGPCEDASGKSAHFTMVPPED